MTTTKDHSPYITVMWSTSGYFAVKIAWCLDMEPPGFDVIQDGLDYYRTRHEAEDEARDWAEAEDVRLVL